MLKFDVVYRDTVLILEANLSCPLTKQVVSIVLQYSSIMNCCHVECLHVESDLVALVIDRVGRSLGIKPDTRTPRSVSDTL